MPNMKFVFLILLNYLDYANKNMNKMIVSLFLVFNSNFGLTSIDFSINSESKLMNFVHGNYL